MKEITINKEWFDGLIRIAADKISQDESEMNYNERMLIALKAYIASAESMIKE